ncbi:MFS transporter [Paludibacterium yongneupense]|uniref:MFS transporter n=1 Tax=Paludibacterium yongneupense TaxID=400061 RepID=UPI00041C4DD3|nr:MFS transporter [Paludibacterium yongneupense]
MLIAELRTRASLFRHRPYRFFAASGLIATFGNGLIYIALAWDGWQRSASLGTLAWLMACLWLPSVVFGPVFGVCADRYDRRALLALSNAVRGVALIVFALAELGGHGLPIAALALTLGIFQAFYFPAALPMVKDMFEPTRRLEANATVDILYEFGTIAGMTASGFLLARTSGAAAFALGGGCFVVAALLCAALPPTSRSRTAEANPWWACRAALGYLRQTKGLCAAYLVQALVMMLLMTVPIVLVPFASRTLGVGAREFSWLEALYSLGVCAGGLLSPVLCRTLSTRRTLFGLIMLLALALALFSLSRTLAQACALYTLVGLGMAAWAVSLTLAQDLTDDAFLGRLQAGSLSVAGSGVLVIYAMLHRIGNSLDIGWIYALLCALALAAACLLIDRRQSTAGA